MRTIEHRQPGPVRFALDVEAASVTICSEERDTASVTIESTNPANERLAHAIERTTAHFDGRALTMQVPRLGGTVTDHGTSTTVVQGDRQTTVISTSFGHVYPDQNVIGATIINGQVIVDQPGTVAGGEHGQLRIIVRLPLGGCSAKITGQAIDVTTRGVLGRLQVDTTVGDVRGDIIGEADVKTTSGGLTVTKEADGVTFRSQSGNLHLAAVREVYAQTMSGDLDINGFISEARLKTMSGDISVHAVDHGHIRASSMSGDITITSSPGIEVDADVHTMSGRTRWNRH